MKRLNFIFVVLFFCLTAKAQNIGIGTPSPDYTLDINGTIGINNFIYHNDDLNEDTWIGFPVDNEFEIMVGGTRMVLADGPNNEFILNPDNQNTNFIIVADGIEHLFHADPVTKTIGIGTSNPQYVLDVSGDFRVIGDQIEHVFFFDASTGKVGIGTETPTEMLDINGTVKADAIQIGPNPSNLVSNIQTGSALLTSDSPAGGTQQIVVTFPDAFTTPPLVIASTVNTTLVNPVFTFGVTAINVSTTSVTFNVNRTNDNGFSPWTDDIQINWIAWE